jgi:hypothetical protein
MSIFIIGFIIMVYFIPTIGAMGARKRNTSAIFLLNLFAGWTFLGWIVALVWAATKDPEVRRRR